MKTKLLLLLLSVVAVVNADNIVIKQKSGNETILELSANPVITFVNEDMIVTTDFTTITLPLDDIEGYVVNQVVSMIQEAPEPPQYHDGHVVFRGVKGGFSASVCSIDGKTVRTYHPDYSGVLDINIGSLSKGVYIITTPNNKIKVINKK